MTENEIYLRKIDVYLNIYKITDKNFSGKLQLWYYYTPFDTGEIEVEYNKIDEETEELISCVQDCIRDIHNTSELPHLKTLVIGQCEYTLIEQKNLKIFGKSDPASNFISGSIISSNLWSKGGWYKSIDIKYKIPSADNASEDIRLGRVYLKTIEVKND